MAARDFSLLALSEFPQAVDHQFGQLERIVINVLGRNPVLGICNFADEHCDCRKPATVHHIASEQEFCERHFQAVTRG